MLFEMFDRPLELCNFVNDKKVKVISITKSFTKRYVLFYEIT